MEKKLDAIIKYLDDNYNQSSPKFYDYYNGNVDVIRFDEHTAISLWPCGAIVCLADQMYFLEGDDGCWCDHMYISANAPSNYPNCAHPEWYKHNGMQTPFNVAWIPAFTNALLKLHNYLKLNGTPIYYSGTKQVSHYSL